MEWRERWDYTYPPELKGQYGSEVGQWVNTSFMDKFNDHEPPRKCPGEYHFSQSDKPGLFNLGITKGNEKQTRATLMTIEISVASAPGCACQHRGLKLTINLGMRYDGTTQKPDYQYEHFNKHHLRW